MQTVLLIIWTRITSFISNESKNYTGCLNIQVLLYNRDNFTTQTNGKIIIFLKIQFHISRLFAFW